MRPEDIQEQLAYLEVEERDRELLQRLRPALEKNADALVSSFYRHLLAFAPTRALLSDPAVKKRLLEKQREYLLSLSDPRLDAEWFEERKSLGRRHVEVGLEPRWYLGAYNLYLKLLLPLLERTFVNDPPTLQRATLALLKIVSLDVQLAMEAYLQTREERLQFLNRELADAGRQLEHRYDEQTQTLRATSERAQAAEQLASVATIVAGLAHEIGTPMGVIQGHAELLESSVVDERGRKRLGTIRDQIERISHIIQTLLNMARPHAPERTLVGLERVIDDTLAFLREKFMRRGVEVVTDFRVRATCLGSHEKLQQLFLNLFLNASDAMPDGGRLTVTLDRSDEEASSAEVRVTDTGHGIPQEIVDRVFEPFFTTKAAGRGSGLGLMVARGIVYDHGGTIGVESEAGAGTTLCMSFPCKDLRAPAK